MSELPRITLYTKANCPLCDEARQALVDAARDFRFAMTTVDIETDAQAHEKYRNLVPVVALNGQELFYGKVSRHRLKAVLQQTEGVEAPPISSRYRAFLGRLKQRLQGNR